MMARRFRLPRSVREAVEWYAHYGSPVALVAGFISDNLFLAKRVDILLTNALILTYLVVSALSIIVINVIQTGRWRGRFAEGLLPILPIIAQFAFGGMFSAYLSLYSRSAGDVLSWIFIAVIAGLILMNERFSHVYARFRVQVPIYFTALFAYLIFALPVLFHRIGPWMFVLSGVVSLLVVGAFIWLLSKIVPEKVAERRWHTLTTIGIIFVIFNVLYFTDVIPPLPLALKGAGVYHSVTRVPGQGYVVSAEPISLYDRIVGARPTYHKAPGEAVYVWTSVFAPTGLSTEVLDQWQFYDPTQKKWVTRSTISYPIQGGRDGGYGGYSELPNPSAGLWRVNVITQYGQVIGRVVFNVIDVPAPVVTETQMQ